MKNIRTPLTIALSALAALLMSGWTRPPPVDSMSPVPTPATRTAAASSPLRQTIAVKEVTGGKESNPRWNANVSSGEFAHALEVSLWQLGLLSPSRQASKYLLIARLQKLDQTLIGASMTVTAAVQYSLIDRATNEVVLERTVQVPHNTDCDNTVSGAERLKQANEKAVRINLQQFIDELLAAKLSLASQVDIGG